MAKVKLIGKGFEKYSGVMGGHQFVEGFSDEMSSSDAERLGAFTRVRIVEDGVVTAQNPSTTQKMVDQKGMSIAPKTAEISQPKAALVAVLPSFDYDLSTLEGIADEGGIKALREFADQYDVRGTSVSGIVKDLMARATQANTQAKIQK